VQSHSRDKALDEQSRHVIGRLAGAFSGSVFAPRSRSATRARFSALFTLATVVSQHFSNVH
jgi:hypothetical protein